MKLADVLYAYDDHEVIYFNLSRGDGAGDEKQESYFYPMLEQLSDHRPLLSTKYGCVEKFIYAHIVVVANKEPKEVWNGAKGIMEWCLPDRFTIIHADKTKHNK